MTGRGLTGDRGTRPVLPDVLEPGLTVVFCGSAAGHASARRQAYYAGPGNRFWWALHAAGFTPWRLAPEEFLRLPDFGIGLTDVCKTASGPDSALPATSDDPAALYRRIAEVAPDWLAFVGKRPAKVFLAAMVGRRQDSLPTGALPDSPFARTRLFVLPSPSGAARGHWNLEPWCELARRAGYAAGRRGA